VNPEGEVVSRELEANRAIGAFWLVEKGLEPGDRLIVSGLQKVRPGAKVKPVPADIPLQPASNGPAGGADGSNANASGKEGSAE
jgi:membrane fusion protein (multidrug efflux system)